MIPASVLRAVAGAGGGSFEVYRDALSDRSTRKAALTGYRLTLVLTGVGRMHWMLERGYAPASGFAEFVLGQAP